MMIKAWAESHGMTLYQGREGEKYPVRRWPKNAGYPCWEYEPWSGSGPAIAQIHPCLAILDADDQEARDGVAAMNLPPHLATRGVSYTKQVITEHHYLSLVGRPKRIVGMTPGLDFLSNPDSLELWIKIWDDGYEVISVQPDHRVPQLPDHLIELHHRAEEEQRQRKAADGDGVPVEKYRAEGIPSGHQSYELYRSACNLAARRFQPDGILAVLTEIVEHSELTRGPWHEHQLASMADRGYRRYGKPPIVVRELEMEEDPDPALYPSDEDHDDVPEPGPEQDSEPEPDQEDLSRHVTTPRLRVAPPAELAEWADTVIRQVLSLVWEMTDAARPADSKADGAQWGNMGKALFAVEILANPLGRLGDLDLLDYQRGATILQHAVLPVEYLDTVPGEDSRTALKEAFAVRFQAGWNAGAEKGGDVPAHLQAALDSWHPPCPLPREKIEAHRLPGRPGRWPVQNHVSKADDRGNGRRLLDHYGGRIRFADDQSSLSAYAFNGQRWLDGRSGGPGLAGEFADQTIQVLPVTEAMSLSVVVEYVDKDGNPVSDRDRFWSWLSAQQSDAKRASMTRCAATIEGMRVPVSAFDADTQWLNTLGGEVDQGRAEIDEDGKWRVVEPVVPHLGQHYAEHYHSRITGTAFDPSATCPQWEQAMKSWLGDDDLIKFTGKLVGASLRGMTTLKVIVLLLGEGDSGKSTFLAVLLDVLGSYAMTAQPSILRKNKGGGTLSDDLADLRGYRLVTTTETSSDAEMDEPRLKRMSGGDRLRARGMWQSSGEWEPQFLLWLATNYVPRLSGEDLALWNRFAPIVFPNKWTETGLTPDGKPCGVTDPNLKQKLLAEAPGILNWILKHLALLYTEGLTEPKAVTDKRNELRDQQDTVGQWLAVAEEARSAAPDTWDPLLTANLAEYDQTVRLTQAIQHYRHWAKDKYNPVGRHPFRTALVNHGYVVTKNGNIETAHGFGHQATEAHQCPVCKEKFR